MQNTPDRHPRKIFRATIPAGFPGRIRHNKQVTATRPLQRNFAAAFRITPNAGCVPETGAARDRTGQDRTGQDRAGQGAWDGTGSSAKEATKKRREEPREQRRSSRGSRGSRKNNDRNSGGARREQRRKQQQEERKKANYSEKSGAALTIRKQHSQKILIIRPLSNRNQIHKSGNK